MPDIVNLSHKELEGKISLPRVLVVDIPGAMLTIMKQSAEVIRNQFHVDPVFMEYDPHHETESLQAIVKYTLDPHNKIEMVLTGNKHNHNEYGPVLVKYLKNAHPEAFKGPMAIHINSAPTYSDVAAAKQVGAIGMYEKAAGLHENGAFAALSADYEKGHSK